MIRDEPFSASQHVARLQFAQLPPAAFSVLTLRVSFGALVRELVRVDRLRSHLRGPQSDLRAATGRRGGGCRQ
jgi:hypothetical protein